MLFEAGNPVALAEKTLALLAAPERWQALRTAGRAFVERERNWAASVARYQPVYAALPKARRTDNVK